MSSIEDYMLPCLNKKLFGFECLGCGLQRAVALIFNGEFFAAFKMYPAIYTLILLAFFLIFNLFKTIKHQESIKKWLFIVNLVIIISSYIYKLTLK
ncbi:DUF2752 domain-containing protein [Formosa haliotis]|uniref:DUF2752 domain-containing protein n=1 Tax=Formosa haliotis TaxID=1555194 RepID=UPI000826FF45|nr:DUF2752 domain-containing protein [Formosa haliotis]